MIADLDAYNASARALQAKTGAVVLSPHYRHAPEHKFPAAHEGVLAGYRRAVANARRLGAGPWCIALVGESAGGALAIDTAITARSFRQREQRRNAAT